MRIEQIETVLNEAYGTNPESYDDQNIEYLASVQALMLVSKKSNDLYLITLVYFNGNVLLTTTKNSDVEDAVLSSMGDLTKPINIMKAFDNFGRCMIMLTDIMRHYRNRIPKFRIMAVNNESLDKLERNLQRPDYAAMIERLGYDYVDHRKDGGNVFIEYSNQ